MTYEMALLMNWLLVAAGLLASDLFSGLFDGSSDDDDAVVDPTGENLGLGDGNDTFLGTDLIDTILGQGGNDSIDGGAGDDMIEGNIGDDSLVGGSGNDILAGGGDTDTMFGGAGNDVLSSDRVDADADFTRGEAEQLNGGEGDDKLFFSSNDVATGGAGADSFGLINTDEGIAAVSDFAVGEDDVTIYIDGLDEADAAPIISYATDDELGSTSVSLDGEVVMEFTGIFTPEELNVTLADTDTLDFTVTA